MDELPPGFVRTPHGFRVSKRVNGHLYTKRFKDAAEIPRWVRWRKELGIRLEVGQTALASTGDTFRDDARTYLAAVRSMPTYRWRANDIALWVAVFGDRVRADIQAHEIRAQLACWRKTYAANTCNHRRTAIHHLWTVLDGKAKPNPVKDVPRYLDESLDSPPRELSAAAMDLILGVMKPSATRARLLLFRHTGWPQAQMKRIDPKMDIRWDDAVRVRPRRKGKGAKGAWLPLLPAAWVAMREMQHQRAFGTFRTDSLRNAMIRAARKARRVLAAGYARRTTDRAAARRLRVELLAVTPYQLRHSFLSVVAEESKDDRAVMMLGQHSDIRTSHRYTERSADPRAVAALAAVVRGLLRSDGSELPEA